MSFISVVCLLYLMVLIDSRTISKSINSYDQTDNVLDAITNLYYTTNHKHRHNRHIYKHRWNDKNDVTKPIRSRFYFNRKHIKSNIHGRDAKTEKPNKIYSVVTTTKIPEKNNEDINTTPKLSPTRVRSIWRKFRNKLRKNKSKDISRETILKSKDNEFTRLNTNNIHEYNYFNANKDIKEKHQYTLEKPKLLVKRDVTRSLSNKKKIFNDRGHRISTTKIKSEARRNHNTDKKRDSTPSHVNLTAELDAITTEVLHLKELYAVDKYVTTSYKPPSYEENVTKIPSIFDTEFPGTAQIEELLNDIKAKAVQMIAEQSPSISDLISNTVTEATFEADPILVHSELATPNFAFSTFVSVNELGEILNKRIVGSTFNGYDTGETTTVMNIDSHDMYRRSIKEDAVTIAQNVEDMLQKELKKVIKKVKNKLACEVQKGMQKSTVAKKANFKTTTLKPETKTSFTFNKNIKSTAAKKKQDKHKKTNIKEFASDSTTSMTTVDDYILLTLYEQILSKTRDDNILKMVTSNKFPRRIRKREYSPHFKRNFETLLNNQLQNDIHKLYDDGVNIPEYDYVVPEDSSQSTETSNTTPKTQEQQVLYEPKSTIADIEETSFEALSNKIAYNDFVNGYKHYLKFQQDQANTNFSNLVRYQAHRHHNVDDIGKYILNKIPQLPENRYKRFFDDNDIDDQEVSTKSDDSWFKKHFYFFIDNGPPKKYHTSQTVSLKYPIATPRDIDRDVTFASNMEADGEDGIYVKIIPSEMDEITSSENDHMNLEELSRTLEDNKKQGTHLFPSEELSTPLNKLDLTEYDHRKLFKPRFIIEKLLGNKKRQTLKPTQDTNEDRKLTKLSKETERHKRNSRYDDFLKNNEFNTVDDKVALHNNDLDYKHGYVNINVIPQPTAIVKLRDNSIKKSKIKNFFKKFCHHKNSKTSKKVKRNSRRQRFNPIKKIKNFFNSKPAHKVPVYNIEDYELISSHIDGFRPIKYQKLMSVDEMRKQIPNISDVLTDNNLLSPDNNIRATTVKTPKEANYLTWINSYESPSYKMINDNNMKYTDSESNFITTTTSTTMTTTKPINIKSSTSLGTKPLSNDFRMNINIKTAKPSTEQYSTSPTQDNIRLMTFDDIRNEIDEIQSKLFRHHKPNYNFSVNKPKSNIIMNRPNSNIIMNDFPKSITENDNIIKKSSFNQRDRNLIHASINSPSVPNKRVPNSYITLSSTNRHTNNTRRKPISTARFTVNSIDNELTIKGKLTRVAKFPISQYRKSDSIQLEDVSDEYNNIDEMAAALQHFPVKGASIRQSPFDPFLKVTVTKTFSPTREAQVWSSPIRSSYRGNNDYFNDLLLWHDDILNTDRVTNPIWKHIIDTIDENKFTTPNIMQLSNELNEIHEYLNKGNLKPRENYEKINEHLVRHVNDTQNIGVIKSLEINDKALALSDGVLIQGEAKYLKYNTPIKFTDSPLKINYLDIDTKTENHKVDSENGVNVIVPDYRRYTDQTDEPSDILIDTTLLAYDDDIDYIWNNKDTNKISRNSLQSPNKFVQTKTHQPVIAKHNKQPKQYYTTPLPMKSNEFQKFLKQNSIDVESVTSPLNPSPGYVDTWSYNTHPNAAISNAKNDEAAVLKQSKNIETITPKETYTEINFKNNYPDKNNKQDKKYDMYNINNTRFKRYNEVDTLQYKKENMRQKKYYDKIKKKMKIFDTKYTRDIDYQTKYNDPRSSEDVEQATNNEVEITIINFKDMNKNPLHNDFEFTTKNVKSTRNIPVELDSMFDDVTKSKSDKFITHNNLLYRDFEKYDKSDKPKIFVDSLDATEAMENLVNLNVDLTTKPNTVVKTHEFLSHLPHFKYWHPPKRLRVSGHTYEYDILYGSNNAKQNTFRDYYPFGKVGRDAEPSTTTLPTPDSHFILMAGRSNNSELDSETNVSRSYNKFQTKRRREREVETSSDEIPVSLSIVYDLKGLVSSTPSISKKDRNKRVFKLLPLLQNKLKSLTKHTSSTLKMDAQTINDQRTQTHDTTEGSVTPEKTGKKQQVKDIKKTKSIHKSDVESERDSRPSNEKYQDNTTQVYMKSNDKSLKNPNQKIDKRDIQHQDTYTAKDVAALEVIVDLMKNTLNYEEKDVKSLPYSNSLQSNYTQKPELHSHDPMNSIEVHIAIPYELQNANKRSLSLEPMRVRKVFSAKMSSPVDLEYQVHSYESLDDSLTTTVPNTTEGLSPGMYLLINNKSAPKNSFALKPITSTTTSQKALSDTIILDKVEMTTSKDSGKITLSKDFIAAINKHIIELLGNTTAPSVKLSRQVDVNNKTVRKARKVDEQKCKGLINWEAVKRFFGHDRVCSCKCKPYKAMCRACAASDAVMGELIFELENLSNYMKDHCTEIQTFFWMNPSGGKKLRDSVHKIDTSMRDYYKRVKGKCQGRTCKTFSTFLDKRHIKYKDELKNDVAITFVNNLVAVAEDLNIITKLATCYDEKLKKEGEKLLKTIDSCLNNKFVSKRSYDNDKRNKKVVKHVYSLDNINVNIICNPEVSTNTENFDISNFIQPESTPLSSENMINALELSLLNKKKTNRARNNLKKFFTKKSKLFSYCVTRDEPRLIEKRDLTQIEAPLISDSGGKFWSDYIKSRTSGVKVATEKKMKPTVGITVIQTNAEVVKSVATANQLLLPTQTTPKTRAVVEKETTAQDLLSYNINQLLKLFGNTEVENMKVIDESPNTTIPNANTTPKLKTKNIKKKKTTKSSKRIKEKYTKHTVDNETSNITASNKNLTEPTVSIKADSTTVTIPTELTTIKSSKHTVKGIFNKIINNLNKGNFLLDEDKLTTVKDKKRYTHIPNNETLNYEATNSTVMVLNEDQIDDKANPQDFKNLLLSIIEHETDKLNNEWISFAYKNEKQGTKEKMDKSKTTKESKSNVDYDIFGSLGDLQLPEPKEKAKPNRLLDKIASKIGIKVLPHDKKAGKKKHLDTPTRTGDHVTAAVRCGRPDPGVEARETERRICDVHATYEHILDLHERLPSKNFAKYVKNLTCYKYNRAKRFFYIQYPKTEKHRRWDWIRRKRCLTFSKYPHGHVKRHSISDDDGFENFVRGNDGIYRIRKRQKRKAVSKDFDYGLRNLAPLKTDNNEVYAIVGDTVSIDCPPASRGSVADAKYSWKTERNAMLDQDNVELEGPRIIIRKVAAQNDGYYSCCENDSVLNKVRVSVVSLPRYAVLFAPSYSSSGRCGKQDLKALEMLGPKMTEELSCQDRCDVTIEEPVCRRQKNSSEYRIKATAAVTVGVHSAPSCSAECRRDLHSATALLVANSVPTLAGIGVVISNDERNKTLLPSKDNQTFVVPRRLKGKDINPLHKYHALASGLFSGAVDVVVACPGGFYLLRQGGVCAPCPANTSSRAGDNVCTARPLWSAVTQGAARPQRRYDWWWYPPCGYLVAGGGAVCACGACVALALLVHVTSPPTNVHGAAPQEAADGRPVSELSPAPSGRARSPRVRPMSPSRVILARFFKPSLTSSRATDSQETKFELWKEKNIPPPLPPIDFDL